MSQNKRKIIIDTDSGHDDALAIMLLLCSGQFDVLAITTCAGNSTIDKATRNAQAILNLIESPVNIHSGADSPLVRELVVAKVHGESGIDGLDVLSTEYELTDDASSTIVEIVEKFPGEVSIVTLGPLTNIANALTIKPSIADHIEQIVMMGGAIAVPGNKNRVAEFNFFVDPEAADIVIRTATPKVLVPLDPCNPIRLYLESFSSLNGKKIYAPLMSMMQHFIAGIQKFEKVNAALVYDALAAYYLVNESAFTTEQMDVVVETKGEHTFGMTVADRRVYSEKNNNITVVTHIDQAAFEKDLIESLQNSV